MTGVLAAHTALTVAAPSDPSSGFSSNGVSGWLQDNAIPVVLLVIGIVILARSHRNDNKGALMTVGVVLVGLFVIGLALSGLGIHFGQWLVHLASS